MPDFQITAKCNYEYVEAIRIPLKKERDLNSFVGTFCVSNSKNERYYVMIKYFQIFNKEIYDDLDFGEYIPVAMLVSPVMNEIEGLQMVNDVIDNSPFYIRTT